MDYDYILACGDSFTEGCQNIIGKGVNGTWPALVANHFGIPFNNIAKGGSSNTIIALQPVLNSWAVENLNKARKPLLIFGFTMHSRLTYFNPRLGKPYSHFSLDPEFMDGYGPWVEGHKPMVHSLFKEQFPNDLKQWQVNHNNPKFLDGDQDECWLDSLTHASRVAIEMAMGYRALIPNCDVIWGFIHEAHEFQGFGKDIFHIRNKLQASDPKDDRIIQYPFEDYCFNKSFDWQPLQRVLDSKNDPLSSARDTTYIIGPRDDGTIDGHPNSLGIQLIADIMIDSINSINT